MTFTYDGPGTSPVGTVRFLLQDTDSSDVFLSDEEIQYAIATWKDLYGTYEYVASVLADTIAAKYAREASVSGDGVSISLGPVGDQFRALAAQLRQQHKNLLVGGIPDAGGITPGEQLGPDLKNFSFGIEMHDDIEAGPQNYGSRDVYWYPAEFYPGA